MRTPGLVALSCSLVLLAGALGCGGLESSTTEAPIAVPPGGFDPPIEPPLVIPGRSAPITDPPRIGRDESRGDGEEARAPGESTGRDTDDGRFACGYICRAFPGCSTPRADGLCSACDDRDIIRSECRPTFQQLEECLRRSDGCGELATVGLAQLALNCGFDFGIAERCVDSGGSVEPSPVPPSRGP